MASSELDPVNSGIDHENMASIYIITEKLTNKNHINYKRLAVSAGHLTMCEFVLAITDSIVLKDRKPKRIIFNNGLFVEFIFKDEL